LLRHTRAHSSRPSGPPYDARTALDVGAARRHGPANELPNRPLVCLPIGYM
jgi:hypothetical protein